MLNAELRQVRITSFHLTVVSVCLAPLLIKLLPPLYGQTKTSIVSASQQNTSTISYDVVSIKPEKSPSAGVMFSTTPDGFNCAGVTLRQLVAYAFGIRNELVEGGPRWTGELTFSVQAKVLGDNIGSFRALDGEHQRAMLRSVLSERFGLREHASFRQLPVYWLDVSRVGSKLHVSELAPAPTIDPLSDAVHNYPGSWTMRRGEFDGHDLLMPTIVDQLSSLLGSNVLDRTGLSQRYSFNLKWTPAPTSSELGAPPDVSPNDRPDQYPPLIEAVKEQLGLNLVAGTGPVAIIVVDAARLPTPN